MSNTIEINGFDELKKLLDAEPQNQVEAMIKAQTAVAVEGVAHLKKGLDQYGGMRGRKNSRKGGKEQYTASPKGSLPYRHTGALQRSIWYKNFANKTTVWTKVGAILNTPALEYAKYLEGKNGNGIRPFLQALDRVVTTERVLERFDKYYKPLEGGK